MRLHRSNRILILWCAGIIGSGCQPSGDSLYKKSDRYYTQAVRYYAQQIKRHPQSTGNVLALAEIYVNHKDYDQAIKLLEGVALPRAREYVAVAMYARGDSTTALDIFERLEKENHAMQPQSSLVFGKVLEEKNLFDQALKVYSHITQSPFAGEAQERIKTIRLSIEMSTLDQETVALIERGRSAQFEDAPAAVILKADERIVISDDNREVNRVHFLMLIKEQRSIEDFGEIHIGYDNTYEKVQLIRARTILPDGRVITVGKKNVRDVSKYLNFPLYSNARVLIISMPEVKVGAVVEYVAEITSSKLIAEKHFSYRYTLQEKYPILEAFFSVTVPTQRPSRYKIVNQQYIPSGMSLNPEITEGPAQKTYRWTFSNVTQIKEEPSRVPSADINPTILISSFTDWKQIYAWWRALYQDKMDVTPEMKAVIDDLVKDKKDAFSKAEALYEFCTSQIRYVGVEYGEAGHTPHKASDIFINRYGDCKDQAVLLVTFMREVGLSAYPVLIPTKGKTQMQEDFPSVLYNHAIAAVELDGQLVFMDPTSEVVRFGQIPNADQDRSVLVFTPDHFRVTKTPMVIENGLTYIVNAEIIDTDNAVIERIITPQGIFGAQHRAYYKYTEPYVIEQDVREKTKRINPFAELMDFSFEGNTPLNRDPVLRYRFKAPHIFLRAGALRILPLLNEIKLDEEWISPEKRQYPLDLKMQQTMRVQTTIKLRKFFSVYHIPASFKVTNPWFDFSVDYNKGADTIYYTEQMNIKKRIILPAEYSYFKKHLETVLLRLREHIILEEKM